MNSGRPEIGIRSNMLSLLRLPLKYDVFSRFLMPSTILRAKVQWVDMPSSIQRFTCRIFPTTCFGHRPSALVHGVQPIYTAATSTQVRFVMYRLSLTSCDFFLCVR